MTFGEALEQLKLGSKVAREGWNGKGMFIYLSNGYESIPRSRLTGASNKHISEDVSHVNINPHIDMKAADGSIVVGWLASQTDMLADDWVIVLE